MSLSQLTESIAVELCERDIIHFVDPIAIWDRLMQALDLKMRTAAHNLHQHRLKSMRKKRTGKRRE